MPDNYLNYSDGVLSVNNPLGAFNNGEKESDYQGRGSFPFLYMAIGPTATAAASTGFNTVYTNATAGGSATIWCSVSVTEPFMMSPLIFAHEQQNSQGFYGIQNLNFKMNINPLFPIWKQSRKLDNGASPPVLVPVPTVQIDSFPLSQLVFCYLTPHPENQFSAKNVVGFSLAQKSLNCLIKAN